VLDQHLLADILDSGPVAYGFLSGVWTAPMVMRVIEERGARVRETKREGTGHRAGSLSHTDTLKEFRQRK
jgi:hypothetical protein